MHDRVLEPWDPKRRTWSVFWCGADSSIGPVLLEAPERCAAQVRIFGMPRIKEERVDECECVCGDSKFIVCRISAVDHGEETFHVREQWYR